MHSRTAIFLLFALYCIRGTSAACNECQQNYASCLNATHFQFCLDGVSPADDVYQCPDGTSCTESQNICDSTSTISCPNAVSSSDCNSCNGRRFTCVSRTEFAVCLNGSPMATTSCDDGQVCSNELFDDPSTKKICAPESVLQYLGYDVTCANVEASTTPAPTTTPVSVDSLRTQCVSAESTTTSTNRFYYVLNANDASCKTYIYCERMTTEMAAILLTCEVGYYSSASRRCVATKPSGCT